MTHPSPGAGADAARSDSLPEPCSPAAAGRVAAGRWRGEVVYLYAFDVAYDMKREPVERLLGQSAAPFRIDTDRRSPRRLSFHQPQTFHLPPVERGGPHGRVRLERTVKLLPVGAISITVRVPFDVPRIEELVLYHDLRFAEGSLAEDVQKLAEETRRELEPFCIRPVPQLTDEEAYTVFCLEAPLADEGGAPVNAEAWLAAHRRQIAAVLTQEPDAESLSQQEAEESTGRYLTYYQNDMVVIDWDAALLVDDRAHFSETLYLMELANLQLAELEAYDRLLDGALDRAYRDLSGPSVRRGSQVLRELRELRIDLARVSEELSNITKFFGDWHLARIYEHVAARFHLADWNRTIDAKLKTLDGIYEILKHDQTNRMMLLLETTIVLLFIIDLVVLISGKG